MNGNYLPLRPLPARILPEIFMSLVSLIVVLIVVEIIASIVQIVLALRGR